MMGFFAFMMTLVLGILVLVGGVQWIQDHRRSLVRPEDGVRGELERMESALAALESRLDDLQDQQRFLERLVAERPDRALPPRPEREEDGAPDSILFDHDEEDR